jgi:hypothetical protein
MLLSQDNHKALSPKQLGLVRKVEEAWDFLIQQEPILAELLVTGYTKEGVFQTDLAKVFAHEINQVVTLPPGFQGTDFDFFSKVISHVVCKEGDLDKVARADLRSFYQSEVARNRYASEERGPWSENRALHAATSANTRAENGNWFRWEGKPLEDLIALCNQNTFPDGKINRKEVIPAFQSLFPDIEIPNYTINNAITRRILPIL